MNLASGDEERMILGTDPKDQNCSKGGIETKLITVSNLLDFQVFLLAKTSLSQNPKWKCYCEERHYLQRNILIGGVQKPN